MSETNDYPTFREAVLSSYEENKLAGSSSPNMQLGENGCLEFSDTGSYILNLSQKVRSDGKRQGIDSVSDICQTILQSQNLRDVSDLFLLTFVTRNIRGGKGEKRLSYQMFLNLWKNYPITTKRLLWLFATHYGYWKDLLLMSEMCKCDKNQGFSDLADAVLNESIRCMKMQYETDLHRLAIHEAGKVTISKPLILSLLPKWLPRENSHFDKTLGFVDRFLQVNDVHMDKNSDSNISWRSPSKALYRKSVAKLTSRMSLPEVLLSAQRADEINFDTVASRATMKLSRALLNEDKDGLVKRPKDPKRQRCAEMFLEHMTTKGLKGATLMPDEIVSEILRGKISTVREKVLHCQWKDLWENVMKQIEAKAKAEGLDFDPSKMVPLCDVSGSMSGKPMEVSIALGIGVSEITHPAFQNLILTFSDTPTWHRLNTGENIVQKVRSLRNADWGFSTNFELAYDQILDVCLKHKLSKKDVPSLIVFSDMQFNAAAACSLSTMHETIRGKFAEAAEKLGWEDSEPTPIVYWNLRNVSGHPVDKDTEGTVLLSGYSPSMLKMVMNGEALKDDEVEVVKADGTVQTERVRVTPSEVLRKVLDDPLYDPVREIMSVSDEGILKEYKVSSPSDDFQII